MNDKVEGVVEELLNPADDARNDVAAAIKQLRGEQPDAPVADEHPDPVEAQPEAPEPAGDDRPRGPDGKFLKTETKEVAPAKAAPEPEITPSTDDQTKASAPASTPTVAPPAGWTAAEKAEWAKLPPAIQTAVSRREAEIANGGRQWSEEKRRYETLIAPAAEASRARGLDVGQGIQLLVAAQNALDRDPLDGIRRIMATYGVTPEHLASNTPAPQPQRVDPIIPQLSQEVSTLKNQLQEFQLAQTTGLVESFASTHPHYDAVVDQLAEVIPLVRAQEPNLPHQQILEKAYERAIWLNPDVRMKLIAEQQAEAQKAQQATVQAKAAQAKKAAVSVRGSSNGAMPPPVKGSVGDVYDDVRNAINQLRQ